MPMYNLIEYSDNYSKTSGSLWQYCKDIPAVNNAGNIADFTAINTTDSFKFKTKITGQTNTDGERNGLEIMVPLKYLSNFWRTLEIKEVIIKRFNFYLYKMTIQQFKCKAIKFTA